MPTRRLLRRLVGRRNEPSRTTGVQPGVTRPDHREPTWHPTFGSVAIRSPVSPRPSCTPCVLGARNRLPRRALLLARRAGIFCRCRARSSPSSDPTRHSTESTSICRCRGARLRSTSASATVAATPSRPDLPAPRTRSTRLPSSRRSRIATRRRARDRRITRLEAGTGNSLLEATASRDRDAGSRGGAA